MMPNFIAYHQSLADEFTANKDQIRNLIGGAHWLSDGGHKEAILRRVLQNKLPDTFRVGTGFFTNSVELSTQVDIIVTDAGKPTLFRNGDFFIVTPDCVRAIIEVKTELSGPKMIEEAFCNLARNIEIVRQHNPNCWAGLFVYEDPVQGNRLFSRQSKTLSKNMLLKLNHMANNQPGRAVNCVSVGPNNFVRFWPQGTNHIGGMLERAGWHSYIFYSSIHHGLSPAYFIGNLAMHLDAPDNDEARQVWFPIQTGQGKEDYRMQYIALGDNQISVYKK